MPSGAILSTDFMEHMPNCATRAQSDDPSNEVLCDRVRAEMGRHVSHPGAIEVSAHDSTVILSGPILADEVDELLCAVQSVRGGACVEDHLEVHDRAGNISALQGSGQRMG